MKYIRTIGTCDPRPLLVDIARAKDLFSLYPARTYGEDSPHFGTKDIWVRYAEVLPVPRDEPHESVWYAGAERLPNVVTACGQLYKNMNASQIGGVLITAIPPYGCIKPHVDEGWHAGYYEKFAIQLLAHPESYFGFEDGKHYTTPGDIFTFENNVLHWVDNPTPAIRMTLIVCLKR